jgi:MFS family permease
MNKWRITFFLFVVLALVIILSAPLWLDNAYWWMDTNQFLQHRPHRPAFQANPLTAGAGLLINLAALFWGGVFVLYLLTTQIKRMADEMMDGFRPLFRITGLGLAILLFALLTAAALALTPMTAPLSLLILILLFLGSILGMTALGFALGRLIVSKCAWDIESPLAIFGFGILTLTLLYRLPYIGIGFIVLTFLIGLGLITTTRLGSGQPWTLDPLLED